jgi:hypothetical protein
MGRLSDTLANNVLDVLFGGASTIAPSTWYVGLSTTTPANDGTGVTEPSGNGYARVGVTKNSTSFPAASSRQISNGTTITFPTASGSGWGTVTHFVLYSASSGGTFLGWGALASAQTVASGATPDFPVGSLVISAPGT